MSFTKSPKLGDIVDIMKTLPIAFASDDKGVLLLGISLYSLLISKNPDTKYRIYILEDKISIENQQKIKLLQDSFDCEIIFVPIYDLLERYITKKFRQWPSTMYGRFFLSSLLPYEKIMLYLDIDTLIIRDLSEIFETKLGMYLMGVVYQRQDEISELWKQRLHIHKSFSYFNSGVLLMNLEKMRHDNIEHELLDYLHHHENELGYPDQDVLNAVLYGRVKRLHPKWNWHASHTRKLLCQYKRMNSRWGHCSIPVMEEAACDPYIIHFPGLPKPISYNYNFYGKLYRKIWLESPWRDIPITGKKRIKYWFRRMFYLPFDWLLKMKIWFLRGKIKME